MSMKTLIQTAQEKKYTEFEPKLKEIMAKKVATALDSKGYFQRLDQAKGLTESEKQSGYKKFYNKTLEKFGVKSPSELDDKKKKEFFNAIDKGWKGENEIDEVFKHKDRKSYTPDELEDDIKNIKKALKTFKKDSDIYGVLKTQLDRLETFKKMNKKGW